MDVFWIETDNEHLRLAIVPRPRGGDWLEDELRRLKRDGVDILVSMLTGVEMNELGLSKEAELSGTVGINYRSFPITDRGAPSSAVSFRAFVEELRTELHAGKRIAVHCRASIGRASIMLAGILCTEGYSVEDAFRRLSNARGLKVPDTPEQIQWIESFATAQRLEVNRYPLTATP